MASSPGKIIFKFYVKFVGTQRILLISSKAATSYKNNLCFELNIKKKLILRHRVPPLLVAPADEYLYK